MLKNRLEQFKKRQREDAAKAQAEMGGVLDETEDDGAFGGDMHAGGVEADVEDDEDDEDDFIESYRPEMSPEPVDTAKMTPDDRRLPFVLEEDELRALFKARHTISHATFMPQSMARDAVSASAAAVPDEPLERALDADAEAVAEWRAQIAAEPRDWGDSESEEEMEEGDLADELDNAAPAAYDWSDKYRPRKPRYFNRVHTGYEWTQYNQTHYEWVCEIRRSTDPAARTTRRPRSSRATSLTSSTQTSLTSPRRPHTTSSVSQRTRTRR